MSSSIETTAASPAPSTAPSTSHTANLVHNGVVKPDPPVVTMLSKSNAIWLYIIGLFTGIFVAMTVTILVGWIINSAFPHSSLLNKVFYGYILGRKA